MLDLCHSWERDDARMREIELEWQTIWDAGAMLGVVAEDLSQDNTQKVKAVMCAVGIEDDCYAAFVHDYEPYVLSKIRKRIDAGHSPLLKESDFGIKNAEDGVNMLICALGWEGKEHLTEPAANLRGFIVNSFVERHGGHKLRVLFGEVEADILDLAYRSGVKLLNNYAQWAKDRQMTTEPKRPYLVGNTREDALTTENYWLVRMFTYFPPRFHFTEPQREILLLARDGFTDYEIAQILGASPDAVKKRWVGIYHRVGRIMPGLLPTAGPTRRGAEKRRALLAHLRDRPEELRAFTRRRAK